MKLPFRRKYGATDWDKFLGAAPSETRKQRLIRECKKLDISIHLDDASETSSGVHAELRGVASEAELERRLLIKTSVSKAEKSNIIAICALVVSVTSLIATVCLSKCL